jgi:hypothetical protein
MTLDTGALINAAASHAAASGHFERVNGAEVTNPPGSGLTCAVWAQRIAPAPRISGLSAAGAQIILQVRIYCSALVQPGEWVDPAVTAAVDALIAAYSGDFTLGGLVMAVDLLGMAGTPLVAEAGWIEAGEAPYRVMTIVLPLLVDNVWTEAP